MLPSDRENSSEDLPFLCRAFPQTVYYDMKRRREIAKVDTLHNNKYQARDVMTKAPLTFVNQRIPTDTMLLWTDRHGQLQD